MFKAIDLINHQFSFMIGQLNYFFYFFYGKLGVEFRIY
jgi:hypothetical protein